MPISVKEVLTAAAELIGDDALKTMIAQENPSGEEISLLLRCFNFVENEVALDYIPLKNSQTLTPVDGQLAYARFDYPPVNILKVTDAAGAPVRFEIFCDHLALPVNAGSVTVHYVYVPLGKEITDNSDFPEKISVRLLAYGTATEYLLACGKYREAATFDEKYRAALRAAASVRRKLTVRARRWA